MQCVLICVKHQLFVYKNLFCTHSLTIFVHGDNVSTLREWGVYCAFAATLFDTLLGTLLPCKRSYLHLAHIAVAKVYIYTIFLCGKNFNNFGCCNRFNGISDAVYLVKMFAHDVVALFVVFRCIEREENIFT